MREPYSFTFYVASWYRKSPYWQRTVEAGCTSWDLYNHMLIPTLYDDDEREYWHLLEKVTLWDVAVERQVEITGPDAFAFTQLLTCRDLSTCDVMQCKWGMHGDVEIVAHAKQIVQEYLPGMEGAQMTLCQEHSNCSKAGHLCPTAQLGTKSSPDKPAETAHSRKVLVLSKQVNGKRHLHRHYARLTLDEQNNLVKLVVSR